jgi:hypothetical protein
MITWLAGYPRSGMNYLRTLLHHYYQIDTYHIYPDGPVDDESRRLAAITGFRPRPMSIPAMAAGESNYFVKTHELPADDFAAIYLIRDGRDALVSYAHFIIRSKALGDATPEEDTPEAFGQVLHDLIFYKASFGGWSRNVMAWTSRVPPPAIIRFEELVKAERPLIVVQQALEAVGRSLGTPTRTTRPPTFAELHEISDRHFRRGMIGGWKDEMTHELIELFWKENGETMGRVGYGSGH